MHVKIILIEDDYYLRDGLCELLQKEDYTVLCAQNCAEGRSLLQKEIYDLAILDIMLPDGSGLDLCTELRKQGNETPILFLTACDEEYQIVRGLDAGADDYITKPFKMLEFLSRVRALLRRRRNTIFQQKDIQIDIANMSVKKDGQNISLTPTEFQIMTALIANAGAPVTRNTLLQRIWDCDGDYIDDNTLSVHVSRLREKIGSEHIVTIRGTGYRWED